MNFLKKIVLAFRSAFSSFARVMGGGGPAEENAKLRGGGGPAEERVHIQGGGGPGEERLK